MSSDRPAVPNHVAPDAASGGRRGLGPAFAVALLAAAAAAGLGVWQLQRLAWKETLLARLAASRAAPAAPLPAAAAWTSLALDDAEFRPFAVSGRFETAQALVFAGPIETSEGVKPGYYVMAAFDPREGGRLLVNRGVIPIDMRRAPPSPPQGETTISGLLRLPDQARWFTPTGDAGKGDFYLREARVLAPALGSGLSPFFLEETPAPGDQQWPRRSGGTQSPPNNHLSYALTWFALAITLLAVFAFRARRS